MNEKEKSLTKNTIFYVLYNILNIIFPLATGIYSARVLLPDAIGLVEFARNFVEYFVILSFLGIPTYGLREISKYRHNKEELSKIHSELLVINFISTCFFGLVYLIIIFSVPTYRNEIWLFLLVGLLIALNTLNNTWLYEGLEEFKFMSIRNLIFKLVSFLCLILFVKEKNDYLWYASITVIGTAGNYFINILYAKKYVKFSLKNLNLKRHMKSIMYLVVVNLAIEIYMLVDITMLGFMCEKKNVAYYSYGIKIHRILIQVINAFTVVVVPRLSLLYKQKKHEMFNLLLSKTFKVIVIIGIPLIIGIWFVSHYFVCLLYGDVYITSSTVLKILSFTLIISPIGYLLGSRVMLATGHENKMIIPVFIGAVANVICNILLIPKMSEIGAAIASVVGECIVMIIYLLISHKHFKIVKVKKTIINVGIACAIMSLYLGLMSQFDFLPIVKYSIDVVGAVIIYFATLLILKEDIVLDIKNKLLGKIKKVF